MVLQMLVDFVEQFCCEITKDDLSVCMLDVLAIFLRIHAKLDVYIEIVNYRCIDGHDVMISWCNVLTNKKKT